MLNGRYNKGTPLRLHRRPPRKNYDNPLDKRRIRVDRNKNKLSANANYCAERDRRFSGGARGTRLCYKRGPGQRALSVPECPVLRERTTASVHTYHGPYSLDIVITDNMQLVLASSLLLLAAAIAPTTEQKQVSLEFSNTSVNEEKKFAVAVESQHLKSKL
ncbi:hypothetical protein RR48_06175 [Papilio machaon]|uniref:Uncharacterized protein n=1 Tax=Papilio machaon TaxID=76193 RepID=A0A194QT93_PAPMA|nr:hypothetical protein RR48_06175 [Papilio machaon]